MGYNDRQHKTTVKSNSTLFCTIAFDSGFVLSGFVLFVKTKVALFNATLVFTLDITEQLHPVLKACCNNPHVKSKLIRGILKELTSAGLRPSREKLAGEGGRDDPEMIYYDTVRTDKCQGESWRKIS